MQYERKRVAQSIGAQLLLQFAGAGVLAGGIALAANARLQSSHLMPLLADSISVFIAALVAVLLVRMLMSDLVQLAQALDLLAHAQPLGDRTLRGGWPLAPLFVNLRLLNQHGDTLATREHVLQQVSNQVTNDVRAHLAQDLHDSIKQELFSLSVSVAATQARWESDPEAARKALADAQQSIREAQVEMSALLQELRPTPLDGAGLLAALREQAEAFGYRTGAQIALDLDNAPTDYEHYPSGIEEALFRMTQESLANIARHARASNVVLRLTQEEGTVRLEVQDNGQGFDATERSGGTGLAALRERALAVGSRAEITSTPGKGTNVKVVIPKLQPLNTTQQTDVEQRAIEQAAQEGRNAHKMTENMVSLAGMLVLLAVPFWLVALVVAIALVAQLHTMSTVSYAVRLAGKGSRVANALRHLEYDISSAVLIFIALCLWCLPVVSRGSLPVEAITVAAILLCLLVACIQLLRAYRLADVWLAQLPRTQRISEVGKRTTRTIGTFALWVSIVVIASAIQSQFHLAFPAVTESQWSTDVILAILLFWPLLVAIEYLNILRWRRWIARSI